MMDYGIFALLVAALVTGILLYRRRRPAKVQHDRSKNLRKAGQEVAEKSICVYTGQTDPINGSLIRRGPGPVG